MDNLEKLLYLNGVAAEYLDYAGQHRLIPREDRLEVLRVAGCDTDNAQAVSAEIFRLDAQPWTRWLQPLTITTEHNPAVRVCCPQDSLHHLLKWELVTEDGCRTQGEFVPAQGVEVGEYYIDGIRHSAHLLPLTGLDPGYHQFRLRQGERLEETTLAVCPERCFALPITADRQKFWGISCQLYTLRSPRNWGIGDFSDLKELIGLAARCGADLVALNPLHILCSDCPDAASPYSPSDRRFLNPLYIDVERIPEFQTCAPLQALYGQEKFQDQLQQQRSLDWVDYQSVNHLKYPALELAYQDFASNQLPAATPRAKEFLAFIARQGEPLQQLASYEAERNPFVSSENKTAEFFCFLQWLAHQQLNECQEYALQQGMAIGVMGDLAVGSVPCGCEVTKNPQLYVSGASIGAPPDPFSSQGQNWGLPPLSPVAMRGNQFQHYIALLRANMSPVGALRIDHVMALMRLWWCLPPGDVRPGTGVYVYYPMQELLALLRLESWRNQCAVIGEDLGVVPVEFRDTMAHSGIYGNDLFYFNRHWDGRFKSPWEQRQDALLSVTNHDVPTLRDWWSGDDLHRRLQLGVITSQRDYDELCRERNADKIKLLQWLDNGGLLPAPWQTVTTTPETFDPETFDLDRELDMAICTAIHRLCARSNARLMLLQLEDLQLMRLPVNIPATSSEYPNWRRKQDTTASHIFSREDIQQLLRDVDRERLQ